MKSLHSMNAQTGTNGFSIRNDVAARLAGKRNAIVVAIATTVFAAMVAAGSANAVSGSVPAKHDDEPQLVNIIARHVQLRPNHSQSSNEQHFILQCPLEYVPVRYSITAGHADDNFFAQTGAQLIDAKKVPVDRTALDSAAYAYPLLNGAGYDIALTTAGAASHGTWNLEIVLFCLAHAASTDYKLAIAKSTTMAAAGSDSTQTAYCSADYPVAVAGFSNSDAVQLKDVGSAPAWGTPSNVIRLRDQGDGPTGPPTGWQSRVFNGSGTPFKAPGAAMEFTAYALCARAPGVRSYIYSTPTLPGSAYSIFAPVSQLAHFVGAGADGGEYGIDKGFDVWMQGGTVVNAQVWDATTTDYDSYLYGVRAYMAQGVDGRARSDSTPQTPGRAVVARLLIPEQGPPPPASSVNVVEFYNAALDHYFITANASEIGDLDRGVHGGWTRTGQSFKAYGAGSGWRTDQHPVCRAYGKPEAGLDTHFYSASPAECFATIANFNGAWVLESSEVFQMDMPDLTTGECAAGGVPVYRTWNGRADSNHRYMTSMALRDQMIAKRHVAEGYGPNSVALCALQ